MTQLYPETEAVLDAALDPYYDEALFVAIGKQRAGKIAAAAISELLEQVLPEHRPYAPVTLDEQHRKVDAWVIRDKVLRIVAELEAL